jgi:hypothetical protein
MQGGPQGRMMFFCSPWHRPGLQTRTQTISLISSNSR